MKNEDNKGLLGLVLAVVIFVIIGLTIALLQPKFEADAFNKFRKQGQPMATYWDAMFSNLRVGNN